MHSRSRLELTSSGNAGSQMSSCLGKSDGAEEEPKVGMLGRLRQLWVSDDSEAERPEGQQGAADN